MYIYYRACPQMKFHWHSHLGKLPGCIVQPHYTVAALHAGDMECDEGPSALSSLAQNMTTFFMNWIFAFFPNTANKDYKILHCPTEFIKTINSAPSVLQHQTGQFPFTTVIDHSSCVSSWSAGSNLHTNGVQHAQPSWKQFVELKLVVVALLFRIVPFQLCHDKTIIQNIPIRRSNSQMCYAEHNVHTWKPTENIEYTVFLVHHKFVDTCLHSPTNYLYMMISHPSIQQAVLQHRCENLKSHLQGVCRTWGSKLKVIRYFGKLQLCCFRENIWLTTFVPLPIQ
jgi:hypothetical protein